MKQIARYETYETDLYMFIALTMKLYTDILHQEFSLSLEEELYCIDLLLLIKKHVADFIACRPSLT